jgi:hypothetical protein
VRGVEPVRAALDQRELRTLHRLVGALARDLERHHGVGVPVDDQRRDARVGELRQVVAEVGAPERGDAVERALRRGELGDVAVVLPVRLADEVRAVPGGEEVRREVLEEVDPVGPGRRPGNCAIVASSSPPSGLSSDT